MSFELRGNGFMYTITNVCDSTYMYECTLTHSSQEYTHDQDLLNGRCTKNKSRKHITAVATCLFVLIVPVEQIFAFLKVHVTLCVIVNVVIMLT